MHHRNVVSLSTPVKPSIKGPGRLYSGETVLSIEAERFILTVSTTFVTSRVNKVSDIFYIEKVSED